jgi:alanyl-tRNA synthetase
VLRRLVRRCIVLARQLGLPPDWYARGAAVLPSMLGAAYPEVARDPAAIAAVIGGEAARFEQTLAQGLRMLERRGALDGKVAFVLLQSHGLPFELTRELAEAAGHRIDEADFQRELETHRERSRIPIGGRRR